MNLKLELRANAKNKFIKTCIEYLNQDGIRFWIIPSIQYIGILWPQTQIKKVLGTSLVYF